ncbi:Uncharacterized protein dnl_09260 [Desulfonema limicola]|uniref:Uncharacterized protein n=1 Tax=Desulfonema limicola TaxID=45656 RepID=A0A975B4M3_9BACT|nr:hypothetical protein [Desulfonema limicola]QTA78696.1 Uncharacterized protein dnl_09260 [Desulfonema limicola]
MNDFCTRIKEKLEKDFVDQYFPVLTQWGVSDEDVLVHSLGCSLWSALGHEMEFMAVTEYPIPCAVGNDIRSDTVWISRDTRKPVVVLEFERYDGSMRGNRKLEIKLSNLMEAAQRLNDTPEILVLSAWSQGVVRAPDMDMIRNTFRQGVKNSKGVFIPGVENAGFLFCRFIFDRGRDNLLRLQQIKTWNLS